MRHRALLSRHTQLGGSPHPLLGDDVDRLGHKPPLASPFQQELPDRLVEHLVWRRAGLHHEMIDAPQRHRGANRVCARTISPDVSRDEQGPLRMRQPAAHVIKQRPVHRFHHRVADDHECDLRAVVHQPLHQLCCLQRINRRLDPVVQGVPLGELLLYSRENGRIFVYCQDHGVRHALTLRPAEPRARYGQHHPAVKAPPERRRARNRGLPCPRTTCRRDGPGDRPRHRVHPDDPRRAAYAALILGAWLADKGGRRASAGGFGEASRQEARRRYELSALRRGHLPPLVRRWPTGARWPMPPAQ